MFIDDHTAAMASRRGLHFVAEGPERGPEHPSAPARLVVYRLDSEGAQPDSPAAIYTATRFGLELESTDPMQCLEQPPESIGNRAQLRNLLNRLAKALVAATE